MLITEADRRIPGTIYDVSVVGLCVETSEELASDVQVMVEAHAFGASGMVRYCDMRGGSYLVGINLDPSRSDPAVPAAEFKP